MATVTQETIGDVIVLQYAGDTLDVSNVKEFKEQMQTVMVAAGKLALDLHQVTFVDSSGLGALLSCLRTLNTQGGDLKLFGLTKQVRALFELVRMQRVFDVFTTREEALRAYA
ncbi:MAG: STAS domain-containing protein [bacterium]|nr:STAS domain-containing protein [bacterium]